MDYSLYFTIRQISMFLLLFLGVHMITMVLPKHMHQRLYKRSLRIMGAAFLIVPLSCIVYTQENQLDLHPLIAPAINITAYFATFVLMALSFLTILGRQFSKLIVRISLATIIVYPLPLWISLVIGKNELFDTVLTASYSFFVIVVILSVILVELSYRRIQKDMENFYPDDVVICVAWISKSMKLMIGLSVTSVVSPIFFTCSYYVKFIFMAYGALCYVYIYYGYQKMLVNITERFIKVNIYDCISQKQEDSINRAINADVIASICLSIEEWVAQNGYTRKGITINDVAKAINSNRTYLSRYINTTYNCSFKSWITSLRIEEAKRLLISHPDLSINIISEMIGFASVESFTHIFTHSMGVAPTKWRTLSAKSSNE